jgi:hypothetical protein
MTQSILRRRLNAWGKRSEYFFLVPQISKCSDVGDDKRHAKLIVGAHLSQREAAVLYR